TTNKSKKIDLLYIIQILEMILMRIVLPFYLFPYQSLSYFRYQNNKYKHQSIIAIISLFNKKETTPISQI
ncbi:hypothetical protein, partial [Bacillus cereus group sp. BceL180]|uniref:hypothetical protein n=1 Tax=Bacillus cereus group sp. BceL180 TaxID=3445049 RepID=UPI003F25C9EC